MCILQSYDGSIRDSVQFKSVQPEEELGKMASKITNIFTKRTQALKVMWPVALSLRMLA